MACALDPKVCDRLRGFAASLCGGGRIAVRITRLPGGLEARAVVRVRARAIRGPAEVMFVAKHLDGEHVREAAVYERLARTPAGRFAPRLLGTDRLNDGSVLLYLEFLKARCPWPWSDLSTTAKVLTTLATLHDAFPARGEPTDDVWDYEALLAARARETLAALEEAPRRFLPAAILRGRPAARRLVLRLGRLRRALAEGPLGQVALVHGDVHSGNVVMPSDRAAAGPLFIDWTRARTASPLEDVSSWLQSLGLWEPEARRKHDTLLSAYLAARGLGTRLGSELRGAYWVAAASNVLAGSLGYHLGSALAATARGAPPSEASAAWHPVEGCMRILRRADWFSA